MFRDFWYKLFVTVSVIFIIFAGAYIMFAPWAESEPSLEILPYDAVNGSSLSIGTSEWCTWNCNNEQVCFPGTIPDDPESFMFDCETPEPMPIIESSGELYFNVDSVICVPGVGECRHIATIDQDWKTMTVFGPIQIIDMDTGKVYDIAGDAIVILSPFEDEP